MWTAVVDESCRWSFFTFKTKSTGQLFPSKVATCSPRLPIFSTIVFLLKFSDESKMIRFSALTSSSGYLGRIRLGSIRNKNNWNNASKRLFGSYSHSGTPVFPFLLFCSQEQNNWNKFRNIFVFRNIPNERALNCAPSNNACKQLLWVYRMHDFTSNKAIDISEKRK